MVNQKNYIGSGQYWATIRALGPLVFLVGIFLGGLYLAQLILILVIFSIYLYIAKKVLHLIRNEKWFIWVVIVNGVVGLLSGGVGTLFKEYKGISLTIGALLAFLTLWISIDYAKTYEKELLNKGVMVDDVRKVKE